MIALLPVDDHVKQKYLLVALQRYLIIFNLNYIFHFDVLVLKIS